MQTASTGSLPRALGAGLAGTLLVTAVQKLVAGAPDAPRMDRIGMRALAGSRLALGLPVPPARRLHREALAGDLVANSLYYGLLAGRARHPWRRGLAIGLLAGIGGALLPQRIGLAGRRHARPRTQAATVALYTLGGLGTALASTWLARRGALESAARAAGDASL